MSETEIVRPDLHVAGGCQGAKGGGRFVDTFRSYLYKNRIEQNRIEQNRIEQNRNYIILQNNTILYYIIYIRNIYIITHPHIPVDTETLFFPGLLTFSCPYYQI